jgi:hypothetical protein
MAKRAEFKSLTEAGDGFLEIFYLSKLLKSGGKRVGKNESMKLKTWSYLTKTHRNQNVT